ncbi:hypothetical protein B9Y82_17925 [Stenotrophomonas maltophilia]|nr:hypothetical protein B9Y82_17925 [Stenotrophomonas maltophilia]
MVVHRGSLKGFRWHGEIVAYMLDAMDLKRLSLPTRCAVIVGGIMLAIAAGYLLGGGFPQFFVQIHQRMQ